MFEDVAKERPNEAGRVAARVGLSALGSVGFMIAVALVGGALRVRAVFFLLVPGFAMGALLARFLGPHGAAGGGWFSALGPILLWGVVVDLVLYAVVIYAILTWRARRRGLLDAQFKALGE